MSIPQSAAKIIENGSRLFAERMPLLGHWQELAELFYYERANFYGSVQLGVDYASGSFSSQAALNRREMGNIYSAMLRPANFFEVKAQDADLNKLPEVRSFFEYATDLQRAVMFRRGSNITHATVLTDHDHVAFGQGVIEVCPSKDRRGVYYRNWHLRDVVWEEDEEGSICAVHRSSKTSIATLILKFGDKVPQTLRLMANDKPQHEVVARHVVFNKGRYDYTPAAGQNHAHVSMWVLPEYDTVLESVGRGFRGYVIPRALRPDGTQYAHSPFTGIVLPDARTQQTIERILLEAGEKHVDPPMIAMHEAIRGDIALYAGGITWADAAYDEKLGDVLRPVASDKSGIPFGTDLVGRYDMTVRAGFMLDKVVLPDTTGMTAYQVRKVVEQQMRANIPIFGPIEAEYSEPLCAESFAVMRALGAFPANEIPEALRGADVQWTFKSPLQDIEEAELSAKLQEGLEIVSANSQLDRNVIKLVNPMGITKDMLRRKGWPEEWLNDDEAVAAAIEDEEAQRQMAEMMAAGGGVAEMAGKAAPMVKALQEQGAQ